jgi:hypothetical protein
MQIPRKDKLRKNAPKQKTKFKGDFKSDRQSHPFYKTKPWRHLRLQKIEELKQEQYDYLETISPTDSVFLLPKVPICEKCLTLYKAGRRTPIELLSGIPVDHIDPVNPDNPLESEGFGEPLDIENLQLLCISHHSKKTTSRDNKIIQRKKK